jgi:hypothetical protein
VKLEQTILGMDGRSEQGPHLVGRAEVLPDRRLRIRIPNTNAGRHAIGFLQDDLLDVVLEEGSVRLR